MSEPAERVPWSAVWMASGLGAALAGVSWLAPVPLPPWMVIVAAGLMLGYVVTVGRALAKVYGWLERRYPTRHAPLRVGCVAVCVGALAVIGGRASPGIDASGVRFPLTGTVSLSAMVLMVVVGFYGIGDLLAIWVRHARSVRSRFIALTLTTATLATLFALWLRERVVVTSFGMDASLETLIAAGVTLLMLVGPAIGFSRLTARRLAEGIERARDALARVGKGALDVTLEIEGRDELAQMATAFNGMVVGLREKAFLESAFGRYASPAVLLALRSAGGLTVPPERREATVVFADIRGFTAWSESVAPEEVMRALNLYFERIVQVVELHGGYVNKFIGDAIMVIFNAPHAQVDHAARGLACARAMQTALAELNAGSAFGAKELAIGVGVNTGALVAGTLGGERRAEYTVIGDTVNVASRLCSNAAAGEVLVGAPTVRAAAAVGLEAIAPLKVKGKVEPLEVFRVPASVRAPG